MTAYAQTSRDAFREAIRSGSITSWKKKVFNALLAAEPSGRTVDELIIQLGNTHNMGRNVQPVTTYLHREGYIYRTKRKRPTRTGALAYVYRVRKYRRPLKLHYCPTCGSKISKKQARKVNAR